MHEHEPVLVCGGFISSPAIMASSRPALALPLPSCPCTYSRRPPLIPSTPCNPINPIHRSDHPLSRQNPVTQLTLYAGSDGRRGGQAQGWNGDVRKPLLRRHSGPGAYTYMRILLCVYDANCMRIFHTYVLYTSNVLSVCVSLYV